MRHSRTMYEKVELVGDLASLFSKALADLRNGITADAAQHRLRGRRKQSEFVDAAVLGLTKLWAKLKKSGRRPPAGVTMEKFIAAALIENGVPLPKEVKEHNIEQWLVNRLRRGKSARKKA
jgi:hypothetical protein